MNNPLSNRALIIISVLVIVVILLVSIISVTTVINEGCTIDILEDFSDNHPFLLQTDTLEFILPTNGSKIILDAWQSIRVACSGENNYLTLNYKDLVTLTCAYDKIFFVGDDYYDFNDLKCVNYSTSSVQKTEKKCIEKYLETEIGFNTSAGFVTLITTCFDEDKKDSIYSIHYLPSIINDKFTQISKNDKFLQDTFYDNLDKELDILYKSSSQQYYFQNILQKPVTDIINKKKYFNRGHLAPKGDFIYKIQKEATLFYLNIAPQWNVFNSGNWNELEKSCRNFVRERNLNLIVYTGVYGNTELLDNRNTLQNLFLYTNKGDNKLSVPKLFWKILYEPILKSGIVFIGHNNPYAKEEKICTDICDKINWLSWQAQNKTLGLSYCCEYTEIKGKITYLPDINVQNILS